MNKIISWLAIMGVLGGLYLLFPEVCQRIYVIIEHGDIPALAEYIQSFGLWGVVITLLLFIIMTFTIVFPFMILSGAAGIVYGLGWGILISWLGEFIGAIVMFVFARYFFRSYIEKWIAKSRYLKQVDDYSARSGFKALLLARLLPLAPSGIITAIAAISKMNLRDFLLATLLGKLPPVVIKVILGHDIALAGENTTRLIIICVFVALLYGAMWYHKHHNRHNRQPEG